METSGHGHYHNDTAHPTEASGVVYDDAMFALVRLAAGGILVAWVLYHCAKCAVGRPATVAPEVLIESAPPPPPAYDAKAPLLV
jgi:hypothetical protein